MTSSRKGEDPEGFVTSLISTWFVRMPGLGGRVGCFDY